MTRGRQLFEKGAALGGFGSDLFLVTHVYAIHSPQVRAGFRDLLLVYR